MAAFGLQVLHSVLQHAILGFSKGCIGQVRPLIEELCTTLLPRLVCGMLVGATLKFMHSEYVCLISYRHQRPLWVAVVGAARLTHVRFNKSHQAPSCHHPGLSLFVASAKSTMTFPVILAMAIAIL